MAPSAREHHNGEILLLETPYRGNKRVILLVEGLRPCTTGSCSPHRVLTLVFFRVFLWWFYSAAVHAAIIRFWLAARYIKDDCYSHASRSGCYVGVGSRLPELHTRILVSYVRICDVYAPAERRNACKFVSVLFNVLCPTSVYVNIDVNVQH